MTPRFPTEATGCVGHGDIDGDRKEQSREEKMGGGVYALSVGNKRLT